MRFTDKLKSRWGVGWWGVMAIMLAFALAGSSVVRLKPLVLGLILPDDAPGWERTVTYILLIMPLYQVCLVAWGTVLGQFRFFWQREKAMGRWILRLFNRKPRTSTTLALVLALVGASAGGLQAKVVEHSGQGFIIEHELVLAVTPEVAFDVMTGDISEWWDHSFSDAPKKLYIEPKPGGGFYEIFDDDGNGARHATVIYAHRGKRLTYAGPLGFSGKALNLVVTYTYVPVDEGTRVEVAVHASGAIAEGWDAIVDKVWHHFLFEQLEPYVSSGRYQRKR